MVVLDDGKAVDSKLTLHRSKIIVEELLEDGIIVLYKFVDRALLCADFFGDKRKWRLGRCNDESKIIVPKIFVKSIGRRNVQKAIDLRKDPGDQFFFIVIIRTEFSADFREAEQNAVLPDAAVDDEF